MRRFAELSWVSWWRGERVLEVALVLVFAVSVWLDFVGSAWCSRTAEDGVWEWRGARAFTADRAHEPGTAKLGASLYHY